MPTPLTRGRSCIAKSCKKSAREADRENWSNSIPMAASAIFIFGYMHCGTTLLQQILSKHPSIYCERKELKFIQLLARIRQLYPDLTTPSKRLDYVAFCIFAIKNALKASSDLKGARIDIYRKEARAISISSLDHLEIFFDVHKHLADTHHYWMDGSPNNAFYHREIRRLLPDAKFIIIVRDVRDVLASKKRRRDTTTPERYRHEKILEQKKLEKNYSCLTDSFSWKSTYALCNFLSKNDSNTLLIRYEDLTREPVTTVRNLCEYLQIEYSDELIDVRFSNSADTSKRSPGIFVNSGQYRSYLSEAEIHVAQSITKNLLISFEYPIETISTVARFNSIFPWLEFFPHLIQRTWNRYKLLGFWNFISFMKFNTKKLFGGLLGRTEIGKN